MRSPTGRGLLLGGALAVLIAGGAAAASMPGGQTNTGTAVPAPSSSQSPAPATAARGPLLLALPAGAPVPIAARLQAAVASAVTNPVLAGGLSVSIVDAASGQVLYERAADRLLLPASTTKIATAVAVLTAVPPETRLATRVVAGNAPGEVVLVGGGDPTFAGPRADPEYPAPARLTDLVRRARVALGSARVTKVLVDESLYTGARTGPGWRPSYVGQGSVAPVGALLLDGGRERPDRPQRVPDPALAAGTALAALLQPGAAVPVVRGRAAPGATVLGEVVSPPVPRLVERMLTDSDNDLAESLARQVALATGRPATFAGASSAVHAVLVGLGVAPGAVALVDGSGLSRDDRLQPRALTRLLARAASGTDPRLAPLLSGLPIAGFDGTLAKRYRGGPTRVAAGDVRAKTGTLNGVSALAGLVRTADDRLLAFDLTADAVPPGGTGRAEAALDGLAAALAGCGCR